MTSTATTGPEVRAHLGRALAAVVHYPPTDWAPADFTRFFTAALAASRLEDLPDDLRHGADTAVQAARSAGWPPVPGQ